MAFNTKIVAKATDISLSLAFNTGPTAAIAHPPQNAEPELKSYAVSRTTYKSLSPINIPIIIVPITEMIVNSIPSLPEAREA